jgi:uncharacterized protein (DUF58 family)
MQPNLARAEALAGPLPALLVAAERVANTVAQGVHGRRRAGQGDSFWQFRPAVAGDTASRIDWRQSARAERLYVRETEWEAAQTVVLWRDGGARMDWRSHLAGETKRARADLLLLALAVLLLRGGEKIRLAVPGMPEFTGRTGLLRLAATLAADPGSDALPDAAALPRHAAMVLIGDMLAPIRDIQAGLAALASVPVRAHVLQLLDPAELELPYDGRVRFESLDGGASMLIPHVASVREAYAARLEAQRGAIAAICAGRGFGFQTHRTDTHPETALLALYSALTPDAVRGRA